MRLFLVIFLFFSLHLEANTHYSRPLSNWQIDRIYHKVRQHSDVNRRALQDAFYFYKKNRYSKKLSTRYLAIADYTKTSDKKRLYVIDLQNGYVHRYQVAHGIRSGARGGRVWRSSNQLNSYMTPYGFFQVGVREGLTAAKRYHYLSIKGLQWSNRKVGLPTCKGGRDVVLHTANYVNWEGRSRGCFAIRPQDKWSVFSKLKQALLYSYTGK